MTACSTLPAPRAASRSTGRLGQGHSCRLGPVEHTPGATPMPPCPVCGCPVQATEWLQTLRREDDGRKVDTYPVYCADHGARWKWADRMESDWTYDPYASDFIRRRLEARPRRPIPAAFPLLARRTGDTSPWWPPWKVVRRRLDSMGSRLRPETCSGPRSAARTPAPAGDGATQPVNRVRHCREVRAGDGSGVRLKPPAWSTHRDRYRGTTAMVPSMATKTSNWSTPPSRRLTSTSPA